MELIGLVAAVEQATKARSCSDLESFRCRLGEVFRAIWALEISGLRV